MPIVSAHFRSIQFDDRPNAQRGARMQVGSRLLITFECLKDELVTETLLLLRRELDVRQTSGSRLDADLARVSSARATFDLHEQ